MSIPLVDIQRVTDNPSTNSGGGHGPMPTGGPYLVQSGQPRSGFKWEIDFIGYKLEMDPTDPLTITLSIGNVELDSIIVPVPIPNKVFTNAYSSPFTMYPGQDVRLFVDSLGFLGITNITLTTGGHIVRQQGLSL